MAQHPKQAKNQNLVKQDNALIKATYDLTLDEKRLLLLAISKVDPDRQFDQKNREPLDVVVYIKDWIACFGGKDNAYNRAYNAMMSLSRKSVEIEGMDFALNWTDSRRLTRPESGKIEFKFGYSVSLFLRGAMQEFTQYRLRNIIRLPSFAAMRLYEAIASFKHAPSRTCHLSIEQIRELTACGDNYPRFSDLNRRVIKPSINAINDKTDLKVIANPKKEGRAVSGFSFRIVDYEAA